MRSVESGVNGRQLYYSRFMENCKRENRFSTAKYIGERRILRISTGSGCFRMRLTPKGGSMTRPYSGSFRYRERCQSSRPNGVTTTNRVRNALAGGLAARKTPDAEASGVCLWCLIRQRLWSSSGSRWSRRPRWREPQPERSAAHPEQPERRGPSRRRPCR